MRSSEAILILGAVLAGCPTAADDDDTPFDCAVGLWQEDGGWVDADGADAELIFGFQGFLWISTRLRADAEGPEVANVRFSAAIEGEPPFGGSQPNVALSPGNGARYSDEIQVRLDNDEGPDPFVGRSMQLDVRATSGARECTASATLTLRDDDPCIHTDDEPICDDDDSAR
jgi:hypothetical protein